MKLKKVLILVGVTLMAVAVISTIAAHLLINAREEQVVYEGTPIQREVACLRELQNTQVGREYVDVEADFESFGYPTRQVRVDGEDLPVTSDYAPYRLNVETEDGNVISAYFESLPPGQDHLLEEESSSCQNLDL